MNLKVLGTNSPYATVEHNCPGFFITDEKTKIMLDCGSGTHRLLNFPNDLENLNVIITHFHRDHYNDIYNLQYSSFVFHNQNRLTNPIRVYLPKFPIDKYNDVVNEELAFAIYSHIDENVHIKIGNIDVNFLRTDHPIETYAVKLSDGIKTIVYTSDTSFSARDRIIEFAKNTDLLISEASLLRDYGFQEINSHLTAYQAAIIAKEANVKTLMLTHLWPEEKTENYLNEAKDVFYNVSVAVENQIVEI